jgi:molybdate transport system ATP-binding protein
MSSVNSSGIRARFRVDWPGFSLDVDLDLPGRGVTALFGHSGSGKTTLLRCIAGLQRAPAGFLSVKAEVWQDADAFLPTYRRPLGYVFQEASLFPHLSARGNLEYGRKRSREALDRAALDHVVDLLGIGPLLERRPDQLSGGERQRVGIARALAVKPRLLLMDEPLAALDLARKEEILPYLERLHDELDIPVLYVSHAPDEVARLADHIVVMEGGRAVAAGPLTDTLARLDLPIRLGEDAGVVLDAVVAARDEAWHLAQMQFAGGRVWVRDAGLPVGHRARVRILARDVSLARAPVEGTSILNTLPAVVVDSVDDAHPALTLVKLRVGESPLLARLTRRSAHALEVAPGQVLYAQIKAVALIG